MTKITAEPVESKILRGENSKSLRVGLNLPALMELLYLPCQCKSSNQHLPCIFHCFKRICVSLVDLSLVMSDGVGIRKAIWNEKSRFLDSHGKLRFKRSSTLTRLCVFPVPMLKASDVLVNVIHQELHVRQLTQSYADMI